MVLAVLNRFILCKLPQGICRKRLHLHGCRGIVGYGNQRHGIGGCFQHFLNTALIPQTLPILFPLLLIRIAPINKIAKTTLLPSTPLPCGLPPKLLQLPMIVINRLNQVLSQKRCRGVVERRARDRTLFEGGEVEADGFLGFREILTQLDATFLAQNIFLS